MENLSLLEEPISGVTIPLHPFYPVGVELNTYLANNNGALSLLCVFFGGWVVILYSTWWASSKLFPRMKTTDKLEILWFILTGLIHLFFEGYFSINHAKMAPAQDLFGQLWKEYAKADSRYLTSEPFVLCMESVTAFVWGPLSFLAAYQIITNHPLRYPTQAIISLGQIYGDVLYYATSLFDLYYNDLRYFRPEAYYFWFYFFFMNFIWIMIPGYLLVQSLVKTSEAFSALHEMTGEMEAKVQPDDLVHLAEKLDGTDLVQKRL